jgi:DNA-binding LacI/PurR family transcriptional regulator
LGKDVGIISYNDSIIKEILLEGITVISTDFQQLGKKAGQIILERKKQPYDNPFYVFHRKSL